MTKNDFNVISRTIHKLDVKFVRPLLAPFRKKKLNNVDFTIISNNCWGGIVYEYFGLKKQSPTIGAYFYAEDYIKFIYNLKYYTELEIQMIEAKDSKYAEKLKAKGQINTPIGKLDDIEIIFLHYKDAQTAKQKWERRCKRINWENLIFKFSYMGECTDEMINEFRKFNAAKKIVFVTKNYSDYKEAVLVPPSDGRQIANDTFYFKKYVDIYKLING